LDNLLHQCTQLYGLVAGLRDSVTRALTTCAYTKWAAEFFSYVAQAAEATNAYLEKLASERNPARLQTYRDRIIILTNAWRYLHDFLKPAVDAHALNTPYALVQLLNAQLREIPSFGGANVIVGLVPTLNYYQHRHQRLRELLQNMQRVVDGCPRFEQKIGFISLPYSRCRALFVNCLLYHELGHFIFEDLFLSARLYGALRPDIEKEFAEKIPNLGPDEVAYLAYQIIPWLEEIFADVLAVKLIGPAYTFATSELTDLMNRDDPREAIRFGARHPPDAMRLAAQLQALTKDCWAGCPDFEGNNKWHPIVTLANKPQSTYLPPISWSEKRRNALWTSTRDILFAHVASMHELAEEVLGASRTNPFIHYEQASRGVSEYLAHGIIPSVLPVDGDPAQMKQVHPTCVLNAAVLFWQRGMPELYDHLEEKQADGNKVAERANLEGRLQSWTAKAIEDWLLIRARTKAQLRVPEVL